MTVYLLCTRAFLVRVFLRRKIIDAQTITAWSGAAVVVLGALGGAVKWWLDRQDAKEKLMIETMKAAAEEAKAAAEEARRDADWQEKRFEAARRDGDRWRMQLVRAGIEPDPAEFTEVPR